ncbi:MAG: alpha/beta hydrolase-fold protein [Proteobacteria bacterium]|nr:alpha/beta hydrolase-fold protein [Pseudomonadota bacterium]
MFGSKRLRFPVVCWAILACHSGWAAQPPLVAYELHTHTIASRFVDQTFEIYVQVPWSRSDGSERFPVLYLTDSYGGMAFADTTRIMQLGGDVPRFITVGIGYKMDSPFHSMEIRQRDLTPVEVENGAGMPPLSTLFKNAPALNIAKKSGGAANFLRFIREELQPYIDANFPTDPKERGYWGDSLGGLFGLYVLFNQPDTFNRYIIGSPSVWWSNQAIVNDAKAYIKDHDRLDATVYMAVGALEETAPDGFSMVTNMFELATLLRQANLTGLKLTTHLFPNETHTSVIGMNYSRGIQEVYGRAPDNFIMKAVMAGPSEAP